MCLWKQARARIHSSEGWRDMNSEPEECLSALEIVAYVDGKLPVDRKAEISTGTSTNAGCARRRSRAWRD